jgi:hypothetical protein
MFFSKWRPNQQSKNIDHHGPEHMLFICHLPNPPYFSTPAANLPPVPLVLLIPVEN